jgi:hypothetical protein
LGRVDIVGRVIETEAPTRLVTRETCADDVG